MSSVCLIKKTVNVFLIMLFCLAIETTPAFASYYSSYSMTVDVGNPANGPSNIPPSQNTCGGKYDLSTNPNFGDPTCDFTKNGLWSVITQYETNTNWQKCWYYVIVPWESSYDPNAYLAASTSTLGAYGLFQMNPQSANRPHYDVGNVYWKLQTYNAIMHNNWDPNKFSYWDPRTLAHDTNGWCK